MKDELQTKLLEILTSIQNTAGKAGDFAMAQLPDIAQSYVVYGRAYETISMMVCILVVLACPWLFARTKKDGWESPNARNVTAIVSGVAAFVAVITAATSLGSFLMVWFAPKVWLLKEIAGLLK